MSGAGPTGRARAVFFGSGSFAVPILEAVADSRDVELVAVISVPDRAAGRRGELTPTPVARLARERGLAVLRPPSLRDPSIVEGIGSLDAVVGVLADYGRIVPPAILALPREGILNVHPSLLPRWRGAAPIQATIAAGDTEAGVTLIAMDAGLDSGPIVAVERWPLSGNETAPDLESRAAEAGAALVRRTLGPWVRGEVAPIPQDAAAVTMTRPLRRDDGWLAPGRPAVELERQVRAFQPWPGSFLETPAGRIIVWSAAIAEAEVGDEAGTIAADDDGLALVAADGRLRLLEVQPAGGRRMPSADLRRGRPELIGARVLGST